MKYLMKGSHLQPVSQRSPRYSIILKQGKRLELYENQLKLQIIFFICLFFWGLQRILFSSF